MTDKDTKKENKGGLEGLNLSTHPFIWARLYCPHYFSIKTPDFHIEIMTKAMRSKRLAIASPRESSKSTLIASMYVLHRIVHKQKRFIILLSNTFGKSCGTLDGIKYEIKNNPNLKQYGITLRKDSEDEAIFTHPDGFETRIICKGHEQMGPIRGERFIAWRPDLIVVDDLEDDDMVRNPDRRRELQKQFDEAVDPALDFKTGQLIVIGTILHDDSLLRKLISKSQYKDYDKLLFVARLPEGTSLWPEKWSVEKLNQIEKDKPSVFAKEYMNNPVAGAMQRFFKKDFRYWTMNNLEYALFDSEGHVTAKGRLSDCMAAIACDLAWETKRESDFSVMLPAFLTPQSDILVDSYICKKGMRPHQMEEAIFSMEQRLRSLTGSTVYVGFEKAKLEKVIKFMLREAMQKRNRWLVFKDLVWDTDKLQRIETRLEPRYAQHSIYHRQGMGDLENQLLRFPSGVHDDIIDALQGVVQLLKYPKRAKTAVEKDDIFKWWQNQTPSMRAKENLQRNYQFGKKNVFQGIPAKISWR